MNESKKVFLDPSKWSFGAINTFVGIMNRLNYKFRCESVKQNYILRNDRLLVPKVKIVGD